MASSRIHTFPSPFPHASDDIPDTSLQNIHRLMSLALPQLLNSLWWILAIRTTPMLVPKVLYRAQIGRSGRPVHPVDGVPIDKVIHNPASVWSRIVILENSTTHNLSQEWQNNKPHDFINIPLSR